MRAQIVSGLLWVLCCAILAGCAKDTGLSLPRASGQHLLESASLSGTPAGSAAVFKSVYSFKDNPDGADPFGGLIAVAGTLYGTSARGGTGRNGTVFEITPAGAETVLYRFTGVSGSTPCGLINLNGTLYGTTYAGGASNYGTVYKITPGGTPTFLYSFQGGSDGAHPYANLIAVNGSLYGTTEQGGEGGTVFKITPSGVESVVYAFTNYPKDGVTPAGPLVVLEGNLYGTTYSDDRYRGGIVFELTTSGVETLMHHFIRTSDGSSSTAGLVYVNGAFYGTTTQGGSSGNGTVFKITPPHAERVLYNFKGGSDGAEPYGGALIYHNGALYGTTAYGGAGGVGFGTVFKLATSGTETILYRFKGGADGANPEAGLLDVNGTLYGTTYAGGSSGAGTVFSITP